MSPQKPEKIGEVFRATVIDLASDGRGVVKHPSGRTFFVPGVWLQEEVDVRVKALKGRIGFGEYVDILQTSAARISPTCSHQGHRSGECGGCPWQFVDYAEQVRAKQGMLQRAFARLNAEDRVLPFWPSPRVFGYRNRAQLKTDGTKLGYVSSQSNTLAFIGECPILSDINRNTLADLLSMLPNSSWQPKKRERWMTLDINEEVSAQSVSVNQRLAFQQGNSQQNDKIKAWLAEKIKDLPRDMEVLELFAGSGNLTEVLAEASFSAIYATEGSELAIGQLNSRQFANVVGLCGDLFTEAGMAKTLKQAKDAKILVLDPPRDGLKVSDPLFSKKSKIKHVFYISCDLATLARDVGHFIENKFTIVDVQGLDQFPHTPHIETLVHLKK